MQDLVSVIIPVYNVEQYLDMCLVSVVQQTYKNIEIILVDDGSKDKSGHLCDEWARKDARIKVVHKQNGGLSDARNCGLKNSKGNYVTFLDSDDYLSENFIQDVIKIMKESCAQIGCAELKTVYTYTEKVVENEVFSTVMDGENAISDLLYEKHLNTSACGKIFARQVIEDVEFPVGKLYEDLATVYKFFLRAKKVVLVKGAYYFYYQRQGSIVNSALTSRHLDIFEAWNNIYKDYVVKQRYPFKAFYSKKLDGIIGLLIKDTKDSGISRLALWNELKTCRKIVLFDNNAKLRMRGEALLSYFGEGICVNLVKWYYARKGDN